MNIQDISQKRTKILATYGPATADKAVVLKLIAAGADVIRFNFSHGTHVDHLKGFTTIKEINKEYGLNIAILADLQGPKIRVGEVENNGVELVECAELIISPEPCIGTAKKVYVSYDGLANDVKVGENLLLDDGKLQIKVTKVAKNGDVHTEVVYGGTLKSRKGVNLPDTNTSVPALTEKDRADLQFALQHGANWIALSFVRKAEDVHELRKLIGKSEERSFIKIISKVEKPEAVKDIDSIIAASDAIMIARGDLGVEVPQEKVPLIQKDIIQRCIQKAKPVVVATQMMESMIENPRPTRAEINDVANAVIDGADAVMLSGETSVGKYPIEVVSTMDKILMNVEDTDIIYNKNLKADPDSDTFMSDAVCYNACKLADSLNADALVGMTRSGYTAFLTSSYRPKAPIYVFTDDLNMLNTLNLCWGVRAFFYNRFVSTDNTIKDVIKILQDKKLVEPGDIVINSASMPLQEQGRTNMIKVTKV